MSKGRGADGIGAKTYGLTSALFPQGAYSVA